MVIENAKLRYRFSLAAMISYNVIIGDTITKIVVRIGGGKAYFNLFVGYWDERIFLFITSDTKYL